LLKLRERNLFKLFPEVAQPQNTTKAAGESPDKKDDAEPVSLKITIGVDGEVKAVTKAVKEEPEASETSPPAAPDALPLKTEIPAKEIPVVAVTPATQPEPTSAPKESSEIEPSKVEAKDPAPEPVIENVKAKAPLLKEGATKAASEPVIKQVEIQNPTPKENGIQSKPAAESNNLPATARQVTSSSVEAPLIATSAITTAATVSNTTTEAPKPTVEARPVPMVTISQESLDALHHSNCPFPPVTRFKLTTCRTRYITLINPRNQQDPSVALTPSRSYISFCYRNPTCGAYP
jgi:hypothetical protein